MKTHVILASGLCSFFVMGCTRTEDAQTHTNLGQGNADVVTKYNQYIRANPVGCGTPKENIPRVLITGFGRFASQPFNIAGAVVGALGNDKFWPSQADLSTSPKGNLPLQNLDLSGPVNAKISRRTLVFNGVKLDVCTIVPSVQWDLAGAIVLKEIERFQPDQIFMAGRGGSPNQAVLEIEAVNSANGMPGYTKTGGVDSKNRPISRGTPILPCKECDIRMTWNQQELIQGAQESVASLNQVTGKSFSLFAATGPSFTNEYICNNLSFIVMHGLKNEELPLANGQLLLHPQISHPTKAGFLHFPTNVTQTPQELFAWGKVLLSMAVAGATESATANTAANTAESTTQETTQSTPSPTPSATNGTPKN